MAAHNILDTAPKRKKLDPRSEPYWQKTSVGRFVGFRKHDVGGTWIARLGKKQKRLGDETEYTYEETLAAAAEWYASVSVVGHDHYTVNRAVDDYIKHLHITRSPKSAWGVERRLYKHLPDAMLKTRLSDLWAKDLKAWHESLVRISDDPERVRKSKASANRVLAHFKAACNLAFRNQRVASDQAWKVVTAFPKAEMARDLFLTDEEVQRLLDRTDGAFHDLVDAAVITGARYGELRAANVEDFDPRHGTVNFDGKTGPRACFLSDAGIAFFRRMAKGKTPKAPLLTGPYGDHWKPNMHIKRMNKAKQDARLPADAVFYSLRHYHISKALLAGVNILVVAKNVGTSVRMIEKNYGKFTAANKREMFNLVELGQ